MTLPIERARTRRPITWLTIVGVLLLPVVIGGILVSALQNPTERLDAMTAAVVNLDEPVEIDGQLTPLGRQLTSGLVEGSDELDSNLTWVISNEDDAAEGLADGTYQAVITIPENFSAAATSAGTAIADGGGSAEQATIKVTTPDDGLVADDLITSQIAAVATGSLGDMLSEATTENILVGFSTIGEQIGEAADGAKELASGARDAATGAAEIPDGAAQLADGASELGSGASQLASGLDTIAENTAGAAEGASQIGAGLTGGASALEDPKGQMSQLVGAASQSASYAKTAADSSAVLAQSLGGNAAALGELAKACYAQPNADASFCDDLAAVSGKIGTNAQSAGSVAESAGYANGYASGVSTGIATTQKTLAASMREAGAGAAQLAGGLDQLADGTTQSANGARELSNGAAQLATGAGALSDGAGELVDGLDQLADGTGTLADGLQTASTSLPSFDESESSSLASVIADPVAAAGTDEGTIFGPTAIPLLTAVVLWFGALATFLVLRAHTARALTSRRASATLTWNGFWPAALIGAAQGLLVSLIVQFVADYTAGEWWVFAGTAMLAGVAFAAVHQALVAVFGGIGRWVAALAGVVAVATGLISTVPGWLAALGDALPTAPAFAGLIQADGAAVAGLVVWGVLAFVATTLAVTVRRTTSTKAVLATA